MSDKVSLKDIKEQAFRGPAEAPPGYAPPAAADPLLYTPPVATVPLPSRGKVYPPESPLFDVASLDIRAMNAYDENIMASANLIRRGKMISSLIKACVISRSIDPEEMLVGDRNAVMVAIRNASYGPKYRAEVQCPACDFKHDNEFDLSVLPILTLDVDPVSQGSNLFEFVLPVTKRRVVFSLMTGHMSAELSRTLESQAKARGPGALEENVTQELLSQIVSVDGVDDRGKIDRFVRSMPVVDSRELRAYVKDVNPDVDMYQSFKCLNCEEKSEVEIPMGVEFFWPKARSGGRRRR